MTVEQPLNIFQGPQESAANSKQTFCEFLWIDKGVETPEEMCGIVNKKSLRGCSSGVRLQKQFFV